MKIFSLALCLLAVCAFSLRGQLRNQDVYKVQEIDQSRVRTEISIPGFNGYQTLKCDFHIHTIFSDGKVWPDIRVYEAWQQGLDAVAITDHIEYRPNKKILQGDLNESYKIAKKAGESIGFIVIKGTEITRDKPVGHLNALFVNDVLPMDVSDPLAAIDEAKKQGAFIMWNHPGWPDNKSTLYPVHEQLIKDKKIDGIEVYNYIEYYPVSFDWCNQYRLAYMANSDMHNTITGDYGANIRPMTLVFATEKSEKGIRDALFAKRTAAFFYGELAGDSAYLQPLVLACLKTRQVTKQLFEVTNKSDISFRMTGDDGNLYIFPAGKTVQMEKPEANMLTVTNCHVGMNKKLRIQWELLTSCNETRQNTLTPKEIADGWKLLFDGKSLNGWKDYNGATLTQPWHVVDECIQATGDGNDASGYIVTTKQYENFELSWDWKLQTGGNSGMLFHVVERPQYSVPYVTGPEYQLIDNEGFPEPLEPWQKLGADYAMYLPDMTSVKINPPGQWNTSKIVFDNGQVEFWLNGIKTIEYEAWTDDWFIRKNSGKWANAPEYGLSHKGVFCLQDHGYPASFRNIKVKELPRKSKKATLFNGKDLHGWDVYGTERWYVKNGLLYCESGPDKQYGYLATRAYYDDFDLTVEFKQESDGNSGVFIRSFIEDGVKVNGWQVEVAPKGYDTGGIYESYGRGWLSQIPEEKENILKENAWNTLRIHVQGDNITTWLNDREMSNLKDKKIGAGQGRIALQIHDGGGIKVAWRNLILQTL